MPLSSTVIIKRTLGSESDRRLGLPLRSRRRVFPRRAMCIVDKSPDINDAATGSLSPHSGVDATAFSDIETWTNRGSRLSLLLGRAGWACASLATVVFAVLVAFDVEPASLAAQPERSEWSSLLSPFAATLDPLPTPDVDTAKASPRQP